MASDYQASTPKFHSSTNVLNQITHSKFYTFIGLKHFQSDFFCSCWLWLLLFTPTKFKFVAQCVCAIVKYILDVPRRTKCFPEQNLSKSILSVIIGKALQGILSKFTFKYSLA